MRAAAALLALLVAAGCGGDGDAAELYTQRCAVCHAIRPGAASPVATAPNLADLRPSAATIRAAVREGRPGMPKELVDDGELERIVAYVAERSGG
jgi:mono/diheme cytochrome c family protein